MSVRGNQINWQAIRERLANADGAVTWRSLAELGGSEELERALAREFAPGLEILANPVTRRRFLQLAAASLGLAGLTACVGAPRQHILPYVRQPEQLVPGRPLFFATAHTVGGYASGLIVESHEGRPTKIEGNRDHPASLGATDAYAQASILSLYDPARSTGVLHEGRPADWPAFERALETVLAQGQGRVRLLTPTITSPTLLAQIERLREVYPQARWHHYEPVNHDNVYEGSRTAFGQTLQPVYDFSAADVILSLDADFLGTEPGRVRYGHDFAARRQVETDDTPMNRLYSVSATPTLTSSMADHHWPLRPAAIESFARLIASHLGLPNAGGQALPAAAAQAAATLASELQQHPGRSLILAGMAQPTAVHTLAAAMNMALGNVGHTVRYIEPVAAGAETRQVDSLLDLVQAMAAGEVDVLLVIGGNPVYTAPAGVDFAAALARVPFSAHLSLMVDETSAVCGWHLPHTHYLEAWSDARAFDGTASIIQPLIEPLFGARSPHELLALLVDAETNDPYDIVRRFWAGEAGDETTFELSWTNALRSGALPNSAFTPVDPTLPAELAIPPALADDETRIVGVFRPDPTIWDGEFSENAWLQELPKPFTKLTWDNAALVDPLLAEAYALATGDMIRIRYGELEVVAPVFVLPGQARRCVTLHLGYGRTAVGEVGTGSGFNAYAVRPQTALWFADGLEVQKTGERYKLATTQNHHAMEGRHLVRMATLQAYRRDPTFAQEVADKGELPSLYPEFPYEGHAWGMSINLNTCTGCQACVVACQAENNIPVVGKEEVANGREMHWLRVDDYFAGDLDNPRIYHQPVPCMHCEKAPCEPVCPVSATTHSAEGLNEMTYGRCVGTRYCANNCPYKVRRFNFLDYTPEETPQNLLYNPDVTVRYRGVMEKCTYCVQRINAARSAAQNEARPIADGEVMTACQQACPAGAIVFGDINNPEATVSQLKALPRTYALLGELGTQPRTTYLAKIWNPNEEI